MSQRRHSNKLPTPEDVEKLLESAQTAAQSQYSDQRYSDLSNSLEKLYTSSLEWLHDGMHPCEILIEALQDERSILDRYNRLQAKSQRRKQPGGLLSEDPVNFPLRFLCTGCLLPAEILEPIFQVNVQTATSQPTWRVCTKKAIVISCSDDPDSPTPSDTSAVLSNKNAGSRLGKLRDAPSPEHEFPDANITLAEIAAFLPQSIKSWDLADRILWNGAGQEDLQLMMNKYRVMPFGKIDNNSTYMMMRGQMRKRTVTEHGYKHWEGWVVGDQKLVPKPADYDPDSISVTGFRRPVIFKDRSDATAEPIAFKDLANGISVWPTGDDALDLTRCVAWCITHPDEDYLYPTHYREVLNCVGGPMNPDNGHTDGAVLKRLRAGTGRSQPRSRTITDRGLDNPGSGDDSSSSKPLKRRRFNASSGAVRNKRNESDAVAPARTTQARRNTRKLTSRLSINDFVDDTDDEIYHGPKRMKKSQNEPRRSGRKRQLVNYGVSKVKLDDYEMDIDDEKSGISHAYGGDAEQEPGGAEASDDEYTENP